MKRGGSVKLLIHSINYAPDMIGVAKYTTEMSEWLAARGHHVCVVTAPPYYPAWRIRDGFSGGRYAGERHAGVDVIRCPLYVPRVPHGMRRMMHLLSFAVSSFPVVIWKSLVWRPDLIICTAPTIVAAPASFVAAKLIGAASWLHVQDFEIDAAFDLGLVRNAGFRKVAIAIERFVMRAFDRVSSISQAMRRRLSEKGVPEGRTVEFRNWVDTSVILPLSGANAYRSELGISQDDTLLLYSGNIGQKQGLEIVVDAARKLRSRSDIHFLICGDGPGRDELAASVSDLTNFHFKPLQPAARFNELLNAADVHLLPQQAGAADLVLPSKLTGMMASGRPVVATAGPGTGIASELDGCGLVVPPGDVEAFSRAILELSDDPARRRVLAAAARIHAEETFARDLVLEKFLLCCRDLVQAKNS